MKEIRITVPFDPATLSPNRRMHWAKRGCLTRQAKLAARLSWLRAGSPKVNNPVRVDITIRRGRKLDHDNAIGGLKAVLDGLFAGSITPDDSTRWLSLGNVNQETGSEWKLCPEVMFIITEA